MNILVAIDSTATAHAVLSAILTRCWPEGTNFHLLNVVSEKVQAKTESNEISMELFKAYSILDRATKAVEAQNPDSIVIGSIEQRAPAKAILSLAKTWPADLIIVGSHKLTFLQRLYVGSVSRSVLESANCAVLVARVPASGPSSTALSNRVMVAVDDSAHSKAAVHSVLSTKWPDSTRFHIVSACRSMSTSFAYESSSLGMLNLLQSEQEDREGIEDMVRDVVYRFESTFGSNYVEYTVMDGQPDEVLLAIARDWRANLVVVASPGRPNFVKRIFGSVSHRIAMQAECSVQIIRSGAVQSMQSKQGVQYAQCAQSAQIKAQLSNHLP